MKHKKYGFTIVELLIVIVVIGVLAAISIVLYSSIQARAKDAVTQQDLASIDRKLQLYYTENQTIPESIGEMTTYGFPATERMVINDGSIELAYMPKESYLVKISAHESSYRLFSILYFNYGKNTWMGMQWAWWQQDVLDKSDYSCNSSSISGCFES